MPLLIVPGMVCVGVGGICLLTINLKVGNRSLYTLSLFILIRVISKIIQLFKPVEAIWGLVFKQCIVQKLFIETRRNHRINTSNKSCLSFNKCFLNYQNV